MRADNQRRTRRLQNYSDLALLILSPVIPAAVGLLRAGVAVELNPTVAAIIYMLSGVFVIVTLIHAAVHLRRPLLFFASSYSVGLGAEAWGVFTGIPFGSYHYVGAGPWALGPRFWILGMIPLAIPTAWFFLGYLTLHVGQAATPTWKWIPISAVTLTCVDIMLDPLQSGRLWTWLTPGRLYGVPLTNFLGWFLVAVAFYSIYHVTRGHATRVSPAAIVAFLVFSGLLGAEAVMYGMWFAAMIALPPIIIISAMALRKTGTQFAASLHNHNYRRHADLQETGGESGSQPS